MGGEPKSPLCSSVTHTTSRFPLKCQSAHRTPLEVTVALHNSIESARLGSQEADLPAWPLQSPEGGRNKAVSGKSRQKRLCSPRGGRLHPLPAMWRILRNRAKSGCDSGQGCAFPAACREGAAQVRGWQRLPRPRAATSVHVLQAPEVQLSPRGPRADAGSWRVQLPCSHSGQGQGRARKGAWPV